MKIIKRFALDVSLIIIFLSLFCCYVFGDIGYKPVSGGASEYKKWCEETFENGAYVYEAYKNIAFNVKYTPEPNKTDFWQIPLETARLKKGDCEDAAFVFFSRLPLTQKTAEIIWGRVVDRRSGIRWVHVWYQLTDKKGKKYVVEGFSKDWNGIIPIEIVESIEERKPILTMSHQELNSLFSLASGFESLKQFEVLANLRTTRDFIGFEVDSEIITRYAKITNLGYDNVLPIFQSQIELVESINKSMDEEIHSIFGKLHNLFLRMKG